MTSIWVKYKISFKKKNSKRTQYSLGSLSVFVYIFSSVPWKKIYNDNLVVLFGIVLVI